MISFNEFEARTRQHSAVVLSDTCVLDSETTMTLVNKFRQEPALCLLESADPSQAQYQDSYIAFDPFLTLVVQSDHTLRVTQSGVTTLVTQTVYAYLDALLAQYQLPKGMAGFQGGVFGYLTYECAQFLESVPVYKTGQSLAQLMIPRTVIRINNVTHHVTVYRWVFADDWASNDRQSVYDSAVSDLAAVMSALYQPAQQFLPPLPIGTPPTASVSLTSSISKPDFLDAVAQAKRYIEAGDIFQIQVSRKLRCDFSGDPLTLYRYLRYTNPSPFMYYARFGDTCLLGSSPELLVGVVDNTVSIRPIAGTRKRRSKTRSEAAMVAELEGDAKERAEHIMLVDLARHDLRRCCVNGTITVNRLMSIERYQHVVHMVSDVSGTLAPDQTSVTALQYGFPAGTVTGAPKIRAMALINELESEARGSYSGAVVFFDFCNQLKSTLIIRSMFIQNGGVTTQAAAGVVADSVPEQEWLETENKMRSAVEAMEACV
jgi:anthranilate synthase component I|tara:strand:- start:2356 stop:3819 length:1464 start_codon:yes stop_codon:yes gene_type:complete